MDFTAALAASKPEERAALVRAQVEQHPWGNHLGGLMTRGGWPESEQVQKVDVHETDDELIARVLVSWIESTAGGCSLYRREYDDTAKFEVRVDRRTGSYRTALADAASNDE